MKIEIDQGSGFCHGVTTAIRKAEEELAVSDSLQSLGDIVHNDQEVHRLSTLGLSAVGHADLEQLHDTKLLLRAHGEPPETYAIARRNNIQLIDATCPVVLHLQKRIKTEYDASGEDGRQIVIYGKNGHAEVVGLVGQTQGTAIVIEDLEDARRLDFTRPISLYSQTTKSLEGFQAIVDYISRQMAENGLSDRFRFFDTICRQVANRIPHIREFAQRHDIVIFVSGKKSSNGRVLFKVCQTVNPRSYIVEHEDEIQPEWLEGVDSVGICGATSTPKWLMEKCRDAIERMQK